MERCLGENFGNAGKNGGKNPALLAKMIVRKAGMPEKREGTFLKLVYIVWKLAAILTQNVIEFSGGA